MSLQDEIERKSSEIQTDSYPMSIGELMNLYRDGELDIHPEFQRVFRWNDQQKARFIESILLGIPIPSIFVAQGEGGIWDVIDGVQRLSTIFEFVGIYKDDDGKNVPPSKLQATKFLPSLEGKVWLDDKDEENSFTSEQRINFKREKLDIKIIKKSSDTDAKYELFQRINTGGTKLSDQEMRNCLMIMTDRGFYYWLADLSQFESFKNCIPLSERLLDQQYDMEIVTRFIVYRHVDIDQISGGEDMGEYITDQLMELVESRGLDYDAEKKAFEKTFRYLESTLSENSFKKFKKDKGDFKGPFLISAFEAIIVGLSENIDYYIDQKDPTDTEHLIKEIYDSKEFADATSKGIRPINRFKKLTKHSRSVFGNGDK